MFCKIAVTLPLVVTTTAAFFAPDKFAKLRGLKQGAFTGLIDVVFYIVCPDCLLLSSTQQYFCFNL